MAASGGTRQPLRPAAAEIGLLGAGMAKLKAAFARRRTVGACPVCGSGALRVKSVERQPLMGELGPQELTLQCDGTACSHSETRMHGYRGPATA